MGSLVDLVNSITFDSGALSFQVPATVTRPSLAAIVTTGIWRTLTSEELPGGGGFQRNEEQRVMEIRQSAVPTMPVKTVIDAPESPGATVKSWRVDGVELVGANLYRVVLIPEPA